MPNPKIRFSECWDKLMLRAPGVRFKTRRRMTPKKAYYYIGLGERGTVLDVELCGRMIGTARVVMVSNQRSADMTEAEIREDTHAEWNRVKFEAQLREWYGMDDLMLLVIELEWVSVIIDNHQLTANPIGIRLEKPKKVKSCAEPDKQSQLELTVDAGSAGK